MLARPPARVAAWVAVLVAASAFTIEPLPRGPVTRASPELKPAAVWKNSFLRDSSLVRDSPSRAGAPPVDARPLSTAGLDAFLRSHTDPWDELAFQWGALRPKNETSSRAAARRRWTVDTHASTGGCDSDGARRGTHTALIHSHSWTCARTLYCSTAPGSALTAPAARWTAAV